MAQTALNSRARGAVFLAIAAGSALMSMLLQSFAAWPFLCGVVAGSLAAFVALAMYRTPATKSWLTIPAVFAVLIGYQIAKNHFSGAQLALHAQYWGVAFAVYGAAWCFGIGGLGRGHSEP